MNTTYEAAETNLDESSFLTEADVIGLYTLEAAIVAGPVTMSPNGPFGPVVTDD
jgi:hypothetical protein